MSTSFSRRRFLRGAAAAAGTGLSLGHASVSAAEKNTSATAAKTTTSAPASAVAWPRWDAREESALADVLRSGKWSPSSGGTRVREFETVFAARLRARFCIATSSGTTALITSLGALNIGPGDEVILPPYTFVATFNAITASFALPVFVDSDAGTFQIDTAKIPAAITPNTKLILPVHIGGYAADLDALRAISERHKIPFVEEACQAHLAEWRGQPVGPIGIGGCFSFQASKNLTSGEGGAIVTNDERFADQCAKFRTPPGASLGRGANFRLTDFQAAILLAQFTRLEEQAKTRDANAAYLSSLLTKIPGITPARFTPGCTRSAYHMYMMRYDREQFAGLPMAKFVQSLVREGVPASSPYSPLNTSAHVVALASNPHYQRIYGKEAMAHWVERNQCPVNDRVCQEAFRFPHTKLLEGRSEMERMVETIARIQKRAGEIVRS
jgi:perosamine synthetase